MAFSNDSFQQIINNRFVVLSPLGQGGFGQVFLTLDEQTKRICAVKLIRPELASDSDIQQRFKKEATIWLEFEKHPNIVNVHSLDFYNGRLFIALEFIPPDDLGINSLDGYLAKRHISLQQALKWSIEICEGMTYAISRGVIAHRDLKPNNLMIDPNNTLKITDFGLTIFSVDPSNKFVDTSPSGTPSHMPPEQFLEGTILDYRSDIYSFGIILYEMLSGGQLPFRVEYRKSQDLFTYFYNLHSTFVLKRFNSPLYPIIAKCLEKDRSKRYQSFEEISQELKKLYLATTGESYRSISKEEMDASEHNNYALSYSFLGDTKRALNHIEKALEIAPAFPPALNNKASFLAQLGKVKEAAAIWLELTETAPNLGRPFYNLGNIFMQQDISVAIDYFKQALKREPDYIPAIVNLAICYQQVNDLQSAIKLYDQALSFDPNDAQIIYNKAFLLYECGDYIKAIHLLEDVIELNPAHISAYNYLGLCYAALNQTDDAHYFFDKALELNPNYVFAARNKAALFNS